MTDFENRFTARWSPTTLIRTGLIVMTLGVAPILLYTLLGPANGNPIGLGIVMVVVVPIGFLILGIGVLNWLIAKLQSPR